MLVPDVIMIGEVIFIGVVACIIFDIWQRLFWLMTGIPATNWSMVCLLYTSPSPRDTNPSRMPSSA